MVKQYVLVSNEQRLLLVQLIHKEGHSISTAAKMAQIYYPTAKAINKVYLRENRVNKKTFRSTI
jgi:transposase